MKSLLAGILLITNLSVFAGNLTLSDIAGTYKITTNMAPIVNVVTIADNGDVKLVELTSEGELECLGYATLVNNKLTSEVLCENDLTFTQTINFEGVQNLNKFTAKIYSSLYGFELEMDVEKLK